MKLPYHQPEKKDLSAFLARSGLRRQQLAGSCTAGLRQSWKEKTDGDREELMLKTFTYKVNGDEDENADPALNKPGRCVHLKVTKWMDHGCMLTERRLKN